MLNNCAIEETSNAEEEQSSVKEIKREKECLVSANNIWYRYNKSDDFVLQSALFDLMEGEVHAILGSNGCGKSTLLKMLAKAYKPVRGKVIPKNDIQVCMMPQDPRALFVCDTLMEDLQELMHKLNYTQNDAEAVLHALDMAELANMHCFDLSGGQLQKAALAKLLLLKPDVLLLDEPAKGLDAKAKQEFISILKKLAANGCAIAIATHDLDFAASVADRCSMLFGGEVTCTENTNDFFCGNMFFTTQTNCMTRNIIGECILPQDVIAKFKVS
jgi:energy-coupling factor transport system ATP-binding protein